MSEREPIARQEARDPAVADPLPTDPLPHFGRWLEEARSGSGMANPEAIALATISADGTPEVRMVLARGVDLDRGFIVFYTDRSSRKGRALAAHARASAAYYWDGLHRQVRLSGPVTESPTEESDRYFENRPHGSRVAATASLQSQPIASREELLAQVARIEAAHPEGSAVPRPERWGGTRLWIESIELWASSRSRLHDRGEWTRTLVPDGNGYRGSAWAAQRLQP